MNMDEGIPVFLDEWFLKARTVRAEVFEGEDPSGFSDVVDDCFGQSPFIEVPGACFGQLSKGFRKVGEWLPG